MGRLDHNRVPTETLVVRTVSRPEGNQVGSPGQDQVGCSNRVGSPGQDQVKHLNLQGNAKGGTPVENTHLYHHEGESTRRSLLPSKQDCVFRETSRPPTLTILRHLRLSYNTKHHQKAKHIKTQYLFIQNNMVQKDQLKVLPTDQFTKHCVTLGISN